MKRLITVYLVVAAMAFGVRVLYELVVESVYSQTSAAHVNVVAPPDASITVVRLDSSGNPTAANLFAQKSWAALAPYTLVLTNNNAQDITGLAVQWQPDGGKLQTVLSDSFGISPKRPVVPAKGQVTLTPVGFNRVDAIATGHLIGVSPQTFDTQPFDRATQVTIDVDAVIFDDGAVLGPDKSGLVASIQGRPVAISRISQTVRKAIAEGQDIQAALRGLLPPPGTGAVETDRVMEWTVHYAGQLLHRPDDRRSTRLSELEALPKPPTFFHK